MTLPHVIRCWISLLLLMAVSLTALAQSSQPIPKLEARVTDFTGTLTAEQQSALEQKLAAFEARKGSQVVVLIIPTTQPEDIDAYSIKVFTQAAIGRKNENHERPADELRQRELPPDQQRQDESQFDDEIGRRELEDHGVDEARSSAEERSRHRDSSVGARGAGSAEATREDETFEVRTPERADHRALRHNGLDDG